MTDDIIGQDVDELRQEEALAEAPIPALPVHVDGPVNVRPMPAVSWQTNALGNFNVADAPYRLLNANPRRKRALIAASASLYICDSRAKAAVSGTPLGLRVPSNTYVSIEHAREVWIATTVDATTVSWFEEFWAD